MTGAPRDPEPGGTPARGLWVAIVLVVAAALVLLVLVLTSGALG